MRLARVSDGQEPDFAVWNDRGWVLLRSLGITVSDTRSLVEHAEIRDADIAAAETVSDPTLLSPVVRPDKIIGIGLNYMDHIRETGAKAPERPVVFPKWPNTIAGPTEDVLLDPATTEQADYEVELAVMIGRAARRVPVEKALDHVFGYLVGNDVSARDWQRQEPQFGRSKSFDTFCPLGPWITTADEVPDPQDLRLTSRVNGEVRQDSTTQEMIFPVAELIAFLSQTMTLVPGDVLLTGTPHGVGMAMDPPQFLRPGDVVRCEVEGLGAIENRIVRDGPGSS